MENSLAEGLRARFVQGVLAVGVHSSAMACGMISTKFVICLDAEYESDSSTSLSLGGDLGVGWLWFRKVRGRKEVLWEGYIFVLALGFISPPAVKKSPLPNWCCTYGWRDTIIIWIHRNLITASQRWRTQ